jgi:transcriptional regulator with XRE-family HTH domain
MKRFYGRVRDKIKQVFGSMEKFAGAWGKTPSLVSKKFNGKVKLTANDIEEICELLGIPVNQVDEYFFYD